MVGVRRIAREVWTTPWPDGVDLDIDGVAKRQSCVVGASRWEGGFIEHDP